MQSCFWLAGHALFIHNITCSILRAYNKHFLYTHCLRPVLWTLNWTVTIVWTRHRNTERVVVSSLHNGKSPHLRVYGWGEKPSVALGFNQILQYVNANCTGNVVDFSFVFTSSFNLHKYGIYTILILQRSNVYNSTWIRVVKVTMQNLRNMTCHRFDSGQDNYVDDPQMHVLNRSVYMCIWLKYLWVPEIHNWRWPMNKRQPMRCTLTIGTLILTLTLYIVEV